MAALAWIIVLLVVVLVLVAKLQSMRRVVVFEYQRGLKYRNGSLRQVLDAGQYWIFPPTTQISIVDVRSQFVTIPSQEVISSDGVTLKISLAAQFEIANPEVAINRNANYHQAFYLLLQMALRQIVSGEKAESILENRASIGDRVAEATRHKIAALGLSLLSLETKDVMLPGELRRTFAQVVKAQKEGQAALERARGETAALRSLANAAKMAEDNPNLLQLRALQMMAESSGNTIMLGVPGNVAAVPPGKNGKRNPESQAE